MPCKKCISVKEKKAAFYLSKVILLLKACAEHGKVYNTTELVNLLDKLKG